MKCELCSSGQREGGRRSCLPCIEAMARLWKIVNSVGEPVAADAVTVQGSVQAGHAPFVCPDSQLKWRMRWS